MVYYNNAFYFEVKLGDWKSAWPRNKHSTGRGDLNNALDFACFVFCFCFPPLCDQPLVTALCDSFHVLSSILAKSFTTWNLCLFFLPFSFCSSPSDHTVVLFFSQLNYYCSFTWGILESGEVYLVYGYVKIEDISRFMLSIWWKAIPTDQLHWNPSSIPSVETLRRKKILNLELWLGRKQ